MDATSEATKDFFSADQFEHYMQEWSKQNEDREAVYCRLLQSLKNAIKEIDHLRMNLESEITSRRQYQMQNYDLEARNKDYDRQASSNPYVIVLVDGDGAKFEDSLIRDAESGGSKAANALKKQVDRHLRGTSLEHGVDVFARVYANFHGLGKVLRQSGLIRYIDDLQKFARGFTNTRPGFDVVDVDYGKENADSKIRHLLKWHYMDSRCKKIFLVVCHDAGYVHDLRPLLDENSDRIVLVETTPAEPAFESLGLSVTQFEDVFRDAPLEPGAGLHTPSSPVQKAPNQLAGATPSQRSAVAGAQPERHGSVEQRSGSYAKVCGDNRHQNIVLSKGNKRRPLVINLNEDGNRIDASIQNAFNAETRATYRQKLAKAKKGAFCNRHYLQNGCEWGPNCIMEHAMELTLEELDFHRFKARTGPCPYGPTCTDMHCSRGHHCPLDPSCERRDCQFRRSGFGDLHLSREKMKAVKRMVEGASFPEQI
ncbi:hypothetical protein LMH87_009426 [Akanthomyces muscarius]|uniref:CCCH zinc finger DNA binding protein n=1 Tax=Akanthomyces muscarius TaxID=2231603 RepID=A0A9W8UL03_AKAMU|nr:hypothetical protein LMH87_009426 [Akanthomyces muscarius]KAJ4152908.1 hypothetical protein LMH87_009426 [Akanthomyces muscarius]